MSLLNIVTKGDVAWVAFDTEGLRLADGIRHPYSKAIPLIHANTLLCGRGERIFLMLAFLGLLEADVTDFDSAAEAMPGVLERAAQGHAQMAAAAGVDVSSIGLEGTLVGWSARRNAPCILVSLRPAGSTTFQVKETPWILAPALENGASPPTTEVEMTCLARAQVAHFRRMAPDHPIGGDLWLAEIARDRMDFRKIADLG